MHSTADLRSDSFAITLGGHSAALADVWPGFAGHDRLGVVVRRPGGVIGASTLIMATVTAFYDTLRARGGDFFVYPDYYVFHVRERRGDHGMLDVWPDHKEVDVPAEAEAVLRAINDRAITRLLVEDAPPGQPVFERQTRASAARIRTALAYAPNGRPAAADVTVTGAKATDAYVAAVIGRSSCLSEAERGVLRTGRARLLADGRPREHFRRLTVEEALMRLV